MSRLKATVRSRPRRAIGRPDNRAASLLVCCHALGQDVSFAVAFVAVMVASPIATLRPTPLGRGTFEAGATRMLGLVGMPVKAGLAATLLLRVLTLWLPLLPAIC